MSSPFCDTETHLAVPASSNWPVPKSPLLAGIVSAIRSRSKSLNYAVADFEIGITTDTQEDVQFERLNLDLASHAPNPDRLSISFWDDGSLWLDCRRADRAGWAYEFSFEGDISDIDASIIRDMIEQSLWVADETQMRLVWSRCNPPRK